MKILVLNAGSSSIKFQLIEMDTKEAIADGIVEEVGSDKASFKIESGEFKDKQTKSIKDHAQGLNIVIASLLDNKIITDVNDIKAVGHRAVQGADEVFKASKIDDNLIKIMEKFSPLAPLHNPANIQGIKVAQEKFPNAGQVAVFDTAFHANMPQHAYMYALPYELYENNKVRKYGMHGTSHKFVSESAAKFIGKDPKDANIIVAHLGNGASMSAVKGGVSVDTSMGLTPLEGLMMGTRCGDMDPAVLVYLARELNMSIDELDNMMNKKSGLKGISGNNDMRAVEDMANSGDAKAKLALDMFAYKVKKYIGSYSAVLGKVDAIAFTGGIGENGCEIREAICSNLENIGIKFDSSKNDGLRGKLAQISTDDSPVKVLVVPTNEELEIAIQTKEVLGL